MRGDIDPRLLEQIAAAGEDGEVEALVLLSDGGDGPAAGAADESAADESREGGPGRRLLERVTRQVKELPAEVRQMPLLGALYIKGSARLVRRLLESDEVVAASANDAEVITAGRPPA